jgi:hypothetical protein
VDITLPPINSTAVERILPKQVQRRWRVDITPPPINNTTAERICSKEAGVGITPPPHQQHHRRKDLPETSSKGVAYGFHTTPHQQRHYRKNIPPMRGFNKVEGVACGLSHHPIVDTLSS